MDVLPDRDMALEKGWTHQVQWVEDDKTYFIRCESGREADFHADRIKKSGSEPYVIDLLGAFQLH